MTTVYTTDENQVYAGAVEIDPLAAMPAYSSLTPPPDTGGAEVAQLTADGWVALPTYPKVVAGVLAVPRIVTRRQALHALRLAGVTKDQVTAAIGDIADPLRRDLALIDWEDSREFERGHPLIASIGQALNFGDEDMDDLFRVAGSLP